MKKRETIKSARNGLKILSAARARSLRSNNLPQTATNLPVPYDIYSENLRPRNEGNHKIIVTSHGKGGYRSHRLISRRGCEFGGNRRGAGVSRVSSDFVIAPMNPRLPACPPPFDCRDSSLGFSSTCR